MKKTIKETVFCAEEYDTPSWPSNALEFLGWFEKKVQSIPKEYQNSAIIEIDSASGYDSHCARMRLYYNRLETDAEEAERELRESDAADRQRKQELRMLAELKAKYGEGE